MNALIEIETITAAVLFTADGWREVVTSLENDVRAMPKQDVTTEEGRKAIASLAHKIARSKTGLEALGKDHVAGLKKQAKAIDEVRGKIWDRLEALQNEVRAPLTEWEAAEKARVEGHANAILQIRELVTALPLGVGSTEIRQRLDRLANMADRDWQEFAEQAKEAVLEMSMTLDATLKNALRREADEIELARLRAETLARAQRERDEAIAREAAEKATRDAEYKAKLEAQRAEDERVAAIARLQEVERQAKAAADRAEFEKAAAIEAERRRAIAEAKQAADEAAAREADKEHRRKINGEAARALVTAGLDAKTARAVIELIAKKMIPNVSINY